MRTGKGNPAFNGAALLLLTPDKLQLWEDMVGHGRLQGWERGEAGQDQSRLWAVRLRWRMHSSQSALAATTAAPPLTPQLA